MPITFTCRCGKELRVADAMAGRKGKCPFCMKVVEVPSDVGVLEEVPPVPAEEDADAKPAQETEEAETVEETAGQEPEEEGEETSKRSDAEDTVLVFRMLSDETRWAIIRELGKGPRNVGALCDAVSLPQPTMSHHLALLRGARLVARQRHGKEIFYSVNTDRLRSAAEALQQALSGAPPAH